MGEFGQTTIKTVPEVPVLALCAKSNAYGDSFSELFTNITQSSSMSTH